ncbi:MAG: hypothetical protein R2865_11320 [Deinococcales bacterium]
MPYYRIGFIMYDAPCGQKANLKASRFIRAKEAPRTVFPMLKKEGFYGGVVY